MLDYTWHSFSLRFLPSLPRALLLLNCCYLAGEGFIRFRPAFALDCSGPIHCPTCKPVSVLAGDPEPQFAPLAVGQGEEVKFCEPNVCEEKKKKSVYLMAALKGAEHLGRAG